MKTQAVVFLLLLVTQAWANDYQVSDYFKRVEQALLGGAIFTAQPVRDYQIPQSKEALKKWNSRSLKYQAYTFTLNKTGGSELTLYRPGKSTGMRDFISFEFNSNKEIERVYCKLNGAPIPNLPDLKLHPDSRPYVKYFIAKKEGKIVDRFIGDGSSSELVNLGIDSHSSQPENEKAPPKDQQNPSFEDQLGRIKQLSHDLLSLPLECRAGAIAQVCRYSQRGSDFIWTVKVVGNNRFDLNFYEFRNNKLHQGKRKLAAVKRSEAEFGLWAMPEAAYPNLLLPNQVVRAKLYFARVKQSPQFLGNYQGWLTSAGQGKIGFTIGSDNIEVLWIELINTGGHDGSEQSVLAVAFKDDQILDWSLVTHVGLRESSNPDQAKTNNRWIAQAIARLCVIDPNFQATAQGGSKSMTLAELDNNPLRQVVTRFFRLAALNNQAEVLSYFRSDAEGRRWLRNLGDISSLTEDQIELVNGRETYINFPSGKLKYHFDGKQLLVGN